MRDLRSYRFRAWERLRHILFRVENSQEVLAEEGGAQFRGKIP